MPYDKSGNYIETSGTCDAASGTCPACDVGGCMRDGMEEKKKPLPDNDTPTAPISNNIDHVAEIVELRAIVSRTKTALRVLRPWVVGVEAHKIVEECLADNGSLTYEIH
jgi:hypothetical protein